MNSSKWVRRLAIFQGVFYALTALWGLIDIDSFMAVTGPKHDIWLVKTVSWLILACATTLLYAAYRRQITPAIAVLAAQFAVYLAGVDIYYALEDTIWDIYLMDALVEIPLVLAWIAALIRDSRRPA